MIAVWDDHELANDAWREGAENHQPASEGPWRARRAAAVRAYLEWMPIRIQRMKIPLTPLGIARLRVWGIYSGQRLGVCGSGTADAAALMVERANHDAIALATP